MSKFWSISSYLLFHSVASGFSNAFFNVNGEALFRMLFKLNRGKIMEKGRPELKGCSWAEFRPSFVLCTMLFLLAPASDIFNCFFLFVCFNFVFKESTCGTRKNVFISLQKLFSFSRESNFRILVKLHFYQMPTQKTRNTFYGITWEVNTVCQWNISYITSFEHHERSIT